MMRETRSTCPYCGVGCGVVIESRDNQITGVRGDPDHPANYGRLCTKGLTLALTASASVTRQTRLLYPMRREHRHEAPQRITWDAALSFAAESFAHTLSGITFHSPTTLLFSNSADRIRDAATAKTALAAQIAQTVRWDECMENIATRQVTCVLELGPGQALTRMWNQRHASIPARASDDFRSASAIAAWLRSNSRV